MTKMWDDLKHNMKEWGSVAVEKAEEVSKIAVAKTEELTKISKLKLDAHQLQRDKTKTFENLGKLVAFHAKEENVVNFTGNKEFFDFLKRLDDIQRKIDDKELDIQKVKDEYNLSEKDIDDIVDGTDGNILDLSEETQKGDTVKDKDSTLNTEATSN